MRECPPGCQQCQQPEEYRGGLGGRLTLNDIAPVNTSHGCPTFQAFPDNHEFFAVCSFCRYTISLPVISATGQHHRVGILPVALLWRGVPGLGGHGLRRILGWSRILDSLLVRSRVLALRYRRLRALRLSHCERRDETQRGHGTSKGLRDIS